MTKLNVQDVEHLSDYLPRIEAGETFLLCRRNVPIAEIRPVPSNESLQRPEIGFAKGTFTIPEEFFEPLPSVACS